MKIRFDWDSGKRQGILTGDGFEDIREHFSVENAAAKFARYMRSFIPSRKYVITPTGRFNIGMFAYISDYVEKIYNDPEIICTDEFTKNAFPIIKTTSIPELKIPLRDYQKDIVEKCLNSGRGTVVLATAGGKTLTIASLIETFSVSKNKNFRAALIVPDRGLVAQTYSDFIEYGVNFTFSKWTGDDNLDLSTNVIICNLGILQSDKSDTDWLEDVDLCIIDEVHKLRSGNKVNNLVKSIHTNHKFGFTGTMPEELIDQWNIVGRIGSIIYERNSFDLRKEKYIADVKALVLNLQYVATPDYTASNPIQKYRNEIEFLIHNKFRNNVISSLCKKFEKNSLVLVDYIDHGVTLHEHLTSTCPDKKVFFIRGDVDIEDREKIKSIMEMNDNIVVVAISKIFSTGINIKNIHYIVFGSGGKAKIKTLQSIGRGLRLHKDKASLLIVDIGDDLTYGKQHLQKRITFYQKENIAYGTQTIIEKGS